LKHVAIISDDRRRVVDVTTIASRLFVLRSHPSRQQIQVYDANSFAQQETLEVKGLSDDTSNSGLASSATNNCLFVSDSCKDTVYKVELFGNIRVSSWRVGRTPCGLSINTECNLIVACYDERKIQEYNVITMSLIREINVGSNESLRPLHAIQLAGGKFIVSCWRVTSSVSDVVEVGAEGKVVVSYTNQLKTTTHHQFHDPRRSTVHENNGLVIVADANNNRIVMLNRSLKCDARELNEMMSVDGGLQQPSCLCFNASKNRLFVGELSGHCRVLVFDKVI
jgi:hypothetical protein